MSSVKVKICGITNWPDAKRAVEEGADFLGFNFYPLSSRYIDPAAAGKIAQHLPKSIATVGVFVNQREDLMLELARTVGLGYLQLHGDESPDAVSRLGCSVSVIKAFQVRAPFRASRLRPFPASAFLLDGFSRTRRGGTGNTFEWSVARRAKRYGRIFLAGGLKPENIAMAIRAAKPYAVDVCSGVEAAPGRKDPQKIHDLMQAVRSADSTSK
jgi:phosphoribosylanthranilate isomerase